MFNGGSPGEVRHDYWSRHDRADRKESVQKADIGKDSSKTKFTAPSAHPLSDVETKFRSEIATDYPDLCSDSLPLQGPSALLPDGTPYTVKLRLKPGMEPESRTVRHHGMGTRLMGTPAINGLVFRWGY